MINRSGPHLPPAEVLAYADADPGVGRECILRRARARLRSAGFDGYVAATSSSVRYVTGFSGMVSNTWPLHGTVLAVVTTDEAQPVTLIVSDMEAPAARKLHPALEIVTYPAWADLSDVSGLTTGERPGRPSQHRPDELDERVRQVLEATALSRGRLGVDLAQIKHSAMQRLRRAAPAAQWDDFGTHLYDTRSVKEAFEVKALHAAGLVAEAGVAAVCDRLAPGDGVDSIRHVYLEGIARFAQTSSEFDGFSDGWVLPGMSPNDRHAEHRIDGIEPGCLLKLDCGATVDGYHSDIARTVAYLAPPSAEISRLYSTFVHGMEKMIEAVRPGISARDLFAIGSSYIHDHGYPNYIRGHLGHSVGLDEFVEEPPFVSAEDTTILEPGMVIAIETPFYGGSLGGFNIEDMALVTEYGGELLTTSSRELAVIG